MIIVRDLHKRFQSFEALRGISLTVRPGEIYGFIGHNGAGKTTTLNILAGLSHPTAGTCQVNGRDVRQITHPSDLQIGYLPEDPAFSPWMSARETLIYLASSQTQPGKAAGHVSQLLEWVGLSEAANRRVGGFSRGMRQRLGIAAALIHDPDLLILDEPSSALDPEGRSDVLRLILQLKHQGKTVLFSTHILSDVERICDTVGIIAHGVMRLEKPMKEIQQAYLMPVFDIELAAPATPELVMAIRQDQEVLSVDIPEPADISRIGSGYLVVAVKDAPRASITLMRLLAEHQAPILAFSQRNHTLEDIFIQEVNGHEAGSD